MILKNKGKNGTAPLAIRKGHIIIVCSLKGRYWKNFGSCGKGVLDISHFIFHHSFILLSRRLLSCNMSARGA